jgi:hypothetical protein
VAAEALQQASRLVQKLALHSRWHSAKGPQGPCCYQVHRQTVSHRYCNERSQCTQLPQYVDGHAVHHQLVLDHTVGHPKLSHLEVPVPYQERCKCSVSPL